MAVEVDMAGLRQLAHLAGEQRESLEFIRDFSKNHLGDASPFSGLLSLFRDEYETAYRAVQESLDGSVTTSGRIAAALDACHDEYRRRDQRSSERMQAINARIDTMRPYREPRGGGWQVPDGLKDVNALASKYETDHWATHSPIRLPIDGSVLPDRGLYGNYTDGLDAVSEVADVASTGQTISGNQEVNHDVDDFLDEHGKGKR